MPPRKRLEGQTRAGQKRAVRLGAKPDERMPSDYLLARAMSFADATSRPPGKRAEYAKSQRAPK